MSKSIWIISKYAVPDTCRKATRHFYIGSELQRRGYDVRVISSNSNHLNDDLPRFRGFAKHVTIKDLEWSWIRSTQYSSSYSAKRVISWVSFEINLFFTQFKFSRKPDIVIVSSLSLLTVFNGLFFKYFYKSKLILEIRDIWPETIVSLGRLSSKNIFVFCLALLERIGYRYSDVIVGTVPLLHQHVSKVLRKSAVNVHHIPQGVSKRQVEDWGVKISQISSAPKSKKEFIVAYAGTLGSVNAVDTLIECARITNNMDIKFLIIGSGGEENRLKSLALGLVNVSFIPKVSRNDLINILLDVDVLYYGALDIDLYRYGISPQKLIDYMLAAKPILSSYSGYDDFISLNQCGLVSRSQDVSALKNNLMTLYGMTPQERIRMGDNGRRYLLKNRTFEKLTDEYISLF